ncbi:30S ribosomal protein S4 [Candidatus Wolfebacteria bacterium]|nr:30S ribosomal protein S4 [Candidatus Wolfebacteria bacterium]
MQKRSKEKQERALGMKLFLKGERCNSPKCAMIRRPNRPGMHGSKRKRNLSEYGAQLLEKQRVRVSYGLQEKQMAKVIEKAFKKPGAVNETIVSYLESQLSNVVFRLGLASSRIVARQLIAHGHIWVNGRKITSSFHFVKKGDVVSIKPSSLKLLIFKDLPVKLKKHELPDWLFLDIEKLEGKVLNSPQNIELPFDIGLVVDYYSK